MADNVTLNSGTGGAVVATDDDGVAHHQYVKLEFGADNTQTKVDGSNPLPVTVTDSATRDLGKVDIAMGQAAHDAAAAALDPVLVGGYASAAAPTDVSADGDAVRAWRLRNGAAATAITAAGALIGGDASNGLDVDVTRSALPTGASTLAEQQTQTTALGAIQTAVQLIDDTVATLGTGTYSEATTKGLVVGAVRRDADTTLVDTTNEIGPLQMDTNGRLKVEAFSGETLPVSLASVPSHAVTNAGTFAVQVDGSALTALQKIDDPVLVDDAAFTPGTSSVSMAGFQADETATDSVDEGDAGAARMTLDRKQIVTPQPHTAGGLSIFRSLDLDETEEDIKTSAGQIYGMWVTNLAASTRFVKFYNATAANVTVGTTTPVITIGIPGNSSDDVAGLFASTMGIEFGTAISAAATTGIADNDTGAPGANEVLINVFYK